MSVTYSNSVAQRDPRYPSIFVRLNRGIAGIAVVLATALSLTLQPVKAQTVRSYDIAPGPLGRALSEFAAEADVTLSFDPTLTRGLTTSGLEGEYSLSEGFRILLDNSELRAQSSGENTYVIRQVENTGTSRETVDRNTPVQTDGNTGTTELDSITVQGVPESAYGPVGGYRARRSATVTRTNARMQDLPASVQVISRDIIEDQGSFELSEVLRNVSGVNSLEGSTLIEARESVQARGFRSRSVYYDGFRVESIPSLDLVNIERVEVAKGPSSILYGQIEPGGVVNLVPERPGRDSALELGFQGGEYGFYRGTLDASKSSESGQFGGRLNASVTHSDSFRDFVEVERQTIIPSLRADLGNRGQVELELIGYSENRPFDEGVSFSADGQPVAPRSTYLGGPSLEGSDFNWNGARLGGNYELTDSMTLRAGLFYQSFEHDWEAFRPLGEPGDEPLSQAELAFLTGTPLASVPVDPVTDNEIFRFYDKASLEVETVQMRLEALSRFRGLGGQHELLVGFDARSLERNIQETRGLDLVNPATGEFLPQKINIRTPTYGDAIPTQNVANGFLNGEQDEWGVYIQDNFVFGPSENWHLLAGLRYDRVEQTALENRAQEQLAGGGGVQSFNSTDSDVTGRIGLLYRFNANLAPYISYSESFAPTGVKVSGNSDELLDPTTGEQYEAGFKFSAFDGDLAGTASVYRIDRDNVPIQDPNDPTRQVNGGEQRSEGFELDMAGQFGRQLQLLGSFGYTQAEVIKSTLLASGTPLRNVPEYTLSATARWDFIRGPLRNWRLIGNVFHSDSRPGDDDNSFSLDEFTVMNLGLQRDWELNESIVSTRVLLKNIADETYYFASNNKSSVVPGEPRTLSATIRIKF